MRRDGRWLGALLDYACYAPNPAIQTESLRLASVLSERLPQLPDLLLQPLAPGLQPASLDSLEAPTGCPTCS